MTYNIGDKARLMGKGPTMTVFALEGEQIALTWDDQEGTRHEMRLPPLLLSPAALPSPIRRKRVPPYSELTSGA